MKNSSVGIQYSLILKVNLICHILAINTKRKEALNNAL